MTATAVSAADEIQHPHKGGRHPVGTTPRGHHLHNWHDHHHHHLHDRYNNDVYYANYECTYNPATLVWDWIHVPVVEEVQPAIEEYNPL
jgi:hypothetical protein